jgi:hypothetical protein
MQQKSRKRKRKSEGHSNMLDFSIYPFQFYCMLHFPILRTEAKRGKPRLPLQTIIFLWRVSEIVGNGTCENSNIHLNNNKKSKRAQEKSGNVRQKSEKGTTKI